MKTVKLSQKRIDTLDKLGKKYGLELHMPPFKKMHCPFFVIEESEKRDKKMVSGLSRSKFVYNITEDNGKKNYILIMG